MSINISTGGSQDPTIVNVGDELTSAQLAALQNAQGASATNPCLTRTNTFNTVDTAVRITQEGTGNSFVVEDSTNPDASPFVINANGEVGIGTSAVTGRKLTVFGQTDMYATDSGTILKVANNSTGISAEFTNTTNATSDCVRITNLGTGNSFVVEDSTNPDASPFIINADGNIGIGRQPTSRKLEMTGNFAVTGQTTLDSSGAATTLVVTQSGTVDACRITNTGTGNSFIVEDDANPDSTPFVISAAGDVAIGTGTPNGKFRVVGRSYFENTSAGGGNAVLWARSSAATTVPVGQFSSDSVHVGPTLLVSNQGSGNSFVVEDSASDTTTFVIDNAGNVTLGGSLTLESAAYNANTALVIDNTNYPHELTFKVGATTYRVPARAI